MVYIILVNWNGWQYTCKCLDSIKKQSYKNFKVIVVDNASTDDSFEKLKAYTPWIELIRASKNLGFGAGNNLAIKYVLDRDAEYIWLLNNDTIILENTLQELLSFIQDKPNIGVAGSVIYDLPETTKLQIYGGLKLNIPRCYVIPCKFWEKPDYISGASMFIRAKALRDAGLFDENFFMYSEDVDLNLRIKNKGWEIGVADKSIVYHKNSASSKSTFKKEFMILKSWFYFARKYSTNFPYTLFVGFFIDRIIRIYPALILKTLFSRLLKNQKIINY